MKHLHTAVYGLPYTVIVKMAFNPWDSYGNWLQKNVGKIYYKWDWRVENNNIRIFFKDEEDMILFLLAKL